MRSLRSPADSALIKFALPLLGSERAEQQQHDMVKTERFDN